jgi:hypothetical protein
MRAEALVVMLAIAVLGGLLVLLLFPDYRIDEILQSNADYFPPPDEEVVDAAPVATPAPEEVSEAAAGLAEIEGLAEDLRVERSEP